VAIRESPFAAPESSGFPLSIPGPGLTRSDLLLSIRRGPPDSPSVRPLVLPGEEPGRMWTDYVGWSAKQPRRRPTRPVSASGVLVLQTDDQWYRAGLLGQHRDRARPYSSAKRSAPAPAVRFPLRLSARLVPAPVVDVGGLRACSSAGSSDGRSAARRAHRSPGRKERAGPVAMVATDALGAGNTGREYAQRNRAGTDVEIPAGEITVPGRAVDFDVPEGRVRRDL
jgi:hypothetical protein